MLLAAGAGRRFGGAKLLQAHWRDRPIVEHSARTLLTVLPDTVAVVADENDALSHLLRQWGAGVVHNPDPSRGMGSSIAAAVRACPDADGWLVALADMPWVRVESIRRVVEALRAGAEAAAPYFDGQRGHPVGFSARFRAQLLNLDGPQGARGLFEAAQGLVRIPVRDPGVLLDVDRPADLQRAPHPINPRQ